MTENTDESRPRSSTLGTAFNTHASPWPMRLIGRVVSGMMIIPVAATMLAALALIIYGAVESWHFLYELFFSVEHKLGHEEALLHAIELIDLFLLATVVQVISLGLYQLYFNQDLELPDWLKIRTLDDLKSKLVGVAVTVLSVYFLGRAITSTGDIEILYLGAASALVIVALTYFLSKISDH
jgi:uncharacterized membrane protein YqhA